MLKSKFENLIKFIESKNIIITTHDFVDIDGLTSCFALKYFINQYFSNKEVVIYFSGLSKNTSEFLDRMVNKFPEFNFSYEKNVKVHDLDVLLVLDANTLNLITLSNEINIPFIFIDHHMDLKEFNKNNLSTYNIILDEISSAAEIIFELFKLYKVELPLVVNWLLISGILIDSGFFRHGNNDTIERASNLLKNGLNFQEILLLLRKNDDISERIAKIKGAQRVEIVREGEYIIGVSYVSNHESSVASTLLNIGFDIGIVLSEKKSSYRITTRTRKDFCVRTGIHLGKILESVGNSNNGSGGGHDGAASLKGENYDVDIIKLLLEKIKQILKKE